MMTVKWLIVMVGTVRKRSIVVMHNGGSISPLTPVPFVRPAGFRLKHFEPDSSMAFWH